MFNAEAISTCNIQIKGKGALRVGDATFHEHHYADEKEVLNTIFYAEDSDESHTFSVFAYLPEATFRFLLNTNPEQGSVYLTFNTNFAALQAGQSGVTYGPGQGDVVWDVEKEKKVIAESITLAVIFRSGSPNSTNG
ncbi:hypothetical protein [Candidatus Nitrotoga sp. AM1P]|uniref:hypothetical protein n=1 Tax=Candidatus Nitrotoga sp. AM1P TaxID=2559597 RepID=UPI0010B2F8A5|nr:hypothetical protein [Candidatus Nitrotoga sp. AM1P]BBJ23296.1 hypothetical protein W01_12230 [Candidatus Nitrotoga sp. AM1P]